MKQKTTSIKAKFVPDSSRDEFVFRKLQYPDLCIPNRTFAWLLSYCEEDSAEVVSIKEQIDEYNTYVENLQTKEGFIDYFVTNNYCLSKKQISTKWSSAFADSVLSLKKYPFLTDIVLYDDFVFDSSIIPKYDLLIQDEILSFSLGENDDGYPKNIQHNSGRTYRLLWNWYSEDWRDFTNYLWQLFDEKALLPTNDEEDERPIIDYNGYTCYDQHRYTMEHPNENLIRCLDILIDADYLTIYSVRPDVYTPLWAFRGKRDGSIDMGILDCSFLSNLPMVEHLRTVLASSDEDKNFLNYIAEY